MNPDHELALLQAIETALADAYRADPDLNDALCVVGLDNAIIALKQAFGFARNETVLRRAGIDLVVAHVVKVGTDNISATGEPSLKDFIVLVNKVKRSVVRHSAFGPRAYFDFVSGYV